MLYNPPTGSTDPNAPYVGKDPVAGTKGSKVPRLAIEATQREIVAAILAAGLSPTNDDLTQLAQAIPRLARAVAPAKSLWHEGDATGSPNAISVTLDPPFTEYPSFLAAVVRMPFSNAAGATIAFNGLGALPLLRNDGSAIRRGDAPAGSDALIGVHGGVAKLMGFGRAETQQIVEAVTLYVRPDGNDSNSGLGNTPDGAVRTPAAAFGLATRYSVPGGEVTVQLGYPSTYEPPNAVPLSGAAICLRGDPLNQDAYAVRGPGAPGVGLVNVASGIVRLQGLQLINTAAQIHTLQCVLGGVAIAENVTFLCEVGNANHHVACFAGGFAQITGGCKFGSSMGGILFVDGGQSTLGGGLGVVNNPHWSSGAVTALRGGRCTRIDATITGAATGRRYYIDGGGAIDSNGAGSNFLPGDVAGFVGTQVPPYYT